MTTPPLRSWTIDMAEVSWIVAGVLPEVLNSIRFAPGCQFDSVIAARSVHRPVESAHSPSPLFASGVSAVLLTVKVKFAAAAVLAAAVPDDEAEVVLGLMSTAAIPAAVVSPAPT